MSFVKTNIYTEKEVMEQENDSLSSVVVLFYF